MLQQRMSPVIAFNLALVLLCILAFLLARRTALPVAAMYSVAAAGTYASGGGGFQHLQAIGLGIDALLLAGLTWIALRRPEHWPIAAASLQLVTAFGHGARLIIPGVWPIAYAIMAQWTAWPSLILLAYGIYRERRAANT